MLSNFYSETVKDAATLFSYTVTRWAFFYWFIVTNTPTLAIVSNPNVILTVALVVLTAVTLVRYIHHQALCDFSSV